MILSFGFSIKKFPAVYQTQCSTIFLAKNNFLTVLYLAFHAVSSI